MVKLNDLSPLLRRPDDVEIATFLQLSNLSTEHDCHSCHGPNSLEDSTCGVV